jgi:hypothetical protein
MRAIAVARRAYLESLSEEEDVLAANREAGMDYIDILTVVLVVLAVTGIVWVQFRR